ncbi:MULTISPECIES: GNAT family N-acetyltransferase [Salinibaculum]|uniref:GNAT family N-acetyltransferase n=1 Tax=Salinibaculum TaxID=2732368 RepID=UPI0030D14961
MSVELQQGVSPDDSTQPDCAGFDDSPPRSPCFEDETGVALHVRPYDEDHFEALVDFYEGYPERHRSMSLPPLARSQIEDWVGKLVDRGRNLTVFAGDRLVGHVAYSPREADEAELVIFVDEQFHNRGIGTELIRQAIAYATEDEMDAILLHVDSRNERAVHVYESIGFELLDMDDQTLKMRLEITEDVAAAVRTD